MQDQYNNELTVLMMGSPRCGKTSVLASIFQTMCAKPFDSYFDINNRTIEEIKEGEIQDSLANKTREMKDFVTEIGKNAKGNSFLIDASKTVHAWTYKLQIGEKNDREKCITMKFIDVPGEWCSLGSPQHKEFQQYAEKSQVFVVVIDTPYLMGPTDDKTMDLCDDNISEAVTMAGVINDLYTVFSRVQSDDSKLVVFVPVKCEKWVRKDQYQAVSQRIKEAYRTTIAKLMARDDMSVAIIPMQTIGSIEFSEFHEAKCLNESSNKCHIVADDPDTLIMADGTKKKKKRSDKVFDDPEFVIIGDVLRPSSWYKAVGSEYKPYNCEQLPLHIMRFMVKKFHTLRSEATITWRDLLNPRIEIVDLLRLLMKAIKSMFGTSDIDGLKMRFEELQDAGIIKDNCEGIEYLKDVFENMEE